MILGCGLCNSVALKIIHDYLVKDSQGKVRVVVISSWDFTYYSAMYPGVLSGQYTEDETRIDVRMLCYACNAEFILATATTVDPGARTVTLEDGRVLSYDILSINVGSRTLGTGSTTGVLENTIMTRPMNIFLTRLQEAEQKCRDSGIVSPRLLVIGSGTSGIELISSIKFRLEQHFGTDISATLLDKSPSVLRSANPNYRKIVIRNLERYSIKVAHNANVKELREGEVELVDGRIIHGEIIIWATGPEPQMLKTGLSLCSRGFIRVYRTLQSVDFPNIYSGGDCITMEGMPYGFPPKTGVHAVQEGPTLALNVIAYARMKLYDMPLSLMYYEPTSDVLQLLNFGDGRGMATKYLMTFSGSWAFKLKDFNDRRLIAKFSPLKLLSSAGYDLYNQVKAQSNARELVYAHHIHHPEEHWKPLLYSIDIKEQDIEQEVWRLTPEMAFSLLMESSDTLKEGSSDEFQFQLQIIKRSDADPAFRTQLIRHYQQLLSAQD